MWIWMLTFLLVLGGIDFSRGAVVLNTNIALRDGADLGADYALTVFQDEAATDGTTVWFDFTGSVLSHVGVNLDESSDWYLVSEFDEFSDTNIIGGSFPVLVKSTPSGFEMGDIDVSGVAGDFFLGVNTGNSDAQGGGFVPRNVFGWVHLSNTRGGLMIVDNAVSYEGRGIIVGTAQAIPEPSGVQVLLAALLLVSVRRCRR